MKEVSLGKLNRGEMCSVAGHEYVVLDQIEDDILCLESKSFNHMPFGKTNDWRESRIRKHLNSDYIHELNDNGINPDNIRNFKIDLKETNGGREYGYDICKVGLLTLEQYIKYAEYILLDPDYWWLATPWGTPQGRSPDTYSSARAWLVNTNGGLGSSLASAAYGIRPALVLPSSRLVSTKKEMRS